MPLTHLPCEHGELPLHVAVPESEDPRPGVVIIHDALGMTTDLQNQARWLADAGFVAVAPDLFHWGGRARCLFGTIRQALARSGPVFDDLELARRWLSDQEQCNGRIAVMGFCLGGGFAVLLAARDGWEAASVNYGAVPKDALELLEGACPIVGSYGSLDSLRTDAERLRTVLDHHGIVHDIVVYPGAGHSFLNDHVESEVPRWADLMGRLSHSEYHPEAADDARRRITEFLTVQLGG